MELKEGLLKKQINSSNNEVAFKAACKKFKQNLQLQLLTGENTGDVQRGREDTARAGAGQRSLEGLSSVLKADLTFHLPWPVLF